MHAVARLAALSLLAAAFGCRAPSALTDALTGRIVTPPSSTARVVLLLAPYETPELSPALEPPPGLTPTPFLPLFPTSVPVVAVALATTAADSLSPVAEVVTASPTVEATTSGVPQSGLTPTRTTTRSQTTFTSTSTAVGTSVAPTATNGPTATPPSPGPTNIGSTATLPPAVPTATQAAATPTATVVSPSPIPTNTVPAVCSPAGSDGFESTLIGLINQERRNRGIAELQAQGQLTTAARLHSADMGCNDFVSHTGSDGSMPWDRAAGQGYIYSAIAENIFAGSSSAQTAFNAWMGSQGHRDNMLNPTYTEIGIGYRYWAGSTYGAYVTAVFARPG